MDSQCSVRFDVPDSEPERNESARGEANLHDISIDMQNVNGAGDGAGADDPLSRPQTPAMRCISEPTIEVTSGSQTNKADVAALVGLVDGQSPCRPDRDIYARRKSLPANLHHSDGSAQSSKRTSRANSIGFRASRCSSVDSEMSSLHNWFKKAGTSIGGILGVSSNNNHNDDISNCDGGSFYDPGVRDAFDSPGRDSIGSNVFNDVFSASAKKQSDMERFGDIFEDFDENSTGYVTVEELRALFFRAGHDPGIVPKLLNGRSQRTGRVTKEEFQRLCLEDQGSKTFRSVMSALAVVDDQQAQSPKDSIAGRRTSVFHADRKNFYIKGMERYQRVGLQRLVMDPNGWAVRIRHSVISVLLIYSSLTVPFFLAFQEQLTWDLGEINWQDTIIANVDLAVDVIFLLEVFLTFLTAYEDRFGDMVYDNRKITVNYVKKWFFFDFISSIPFLYFLPSTCDACGNERGVGSIFAFPHVGKAALRVIRIFSLVKLFRVFKTCGKISGWCAANTRDGFAYARSAGQVMVVQGSAYRYGDARGPSTGKLDSMFKTFFVFLLIVHVWACMWVFIAHIRADGHTTWIEVLQSGETIEGPYDPDIANIYVNAMYWVVMTLTTVGYGDIDISPRNNLERMFAVVTMVFAFIMYGIVVATISNITNALQRRSDELRDKLQEMSVFARQVRLDPALYYKIRRFIEVKHHDGFEELDQVHTENSSFLINELPWRLRHQMIANMHEGRHLALRLLKEVKSPEFVCQIVPCMRCVMYQPNEMLYETQDYAELVYCVVEGDVGLVLAAEKKDPENQDGDESPGGFRGLNRNRTKDFEAPFELYTSNDTVGECEVILNLPRLTGATALESEATVLVLHKRDLCRALAEFPSVADYLQRRVCRHYQNIRRRIDYRMAKRGEVDSRKIIIFQINYVSTFN